MAGLDGVVQRLSDERDEKRASAEDLLRDVEALNQAIQAIKTSMNGEDISVVNPFKTPTLPWHVFEILLEHVEPMSVKQIHQVVLITRPGCSESGISNAIYSHPEAFEKVGDGMFQLVPR